MTTTDIAAPPVPSDPAVPGTRELVARGSRVLGAFLDERGWALDTARPAQVVWRPGRSLDVRFQARVRAPGGDPRLLTLCIERAARPKPPPPPPAGFEARYGLADPVGVVDGALVWAFPYDPSLPGLFDAAQGPKVRDALGASGRRPSGVAVQPLRYRPRRRAVSTTSPCTTTGARSCTARCCVPTGPRSSSTTCRPSPAGTVAACASACPTAASTPVRCSFPHSRAARCATCCSFNQMLGSLETTYRSQQQFLSDASHELRTPLTVARGQLELLGDELGDASSRRALGTATDEIDRMGRIVEDLLLLARLDEGLPLGRQPVEVELVLREALLRGTQGATRDARVDTEPGLTALADLDRLLQVVTNLVTNAVQHTDADAALTLSAGRAGERVVLRVADSGPGIPPEDLPHIFERFHRGEPAGTGAPGGTGLGLAIVASLVRAMGGDVDVQSVPGQGTAFTVSLPAAD